MEDSVPQQVKKIKPNTRSHAIEAAARSRVRLVAVFIPLAFVLGLLSGYLLWGRAAPLAAAQTAPTQAAGVPAADAADQQNSAQTEATQQQITRYDVPVDDDPILGPVDAPITIIEFSDYQCPYCRKWHTEVLATLMAAYPEQVRFVYRDFPLTRIHPEALPAAMAANCAGEQGQYYEYQSLLFGMQYELGAEAYAQYAADLDLDAEAFEECVSSGRHENEVLADLNWAANLGVGSTPTFFINGIPVVGAQPYEVFQNVINKELAGGFN